MTAPLLERDDELRAAAAGLDAARAGEGSLVVIEGPGGIGKTELVLATQRRAAHDGLAVASARGSELEQQLAFGVVRQLFERAVAEDAEGLLQGAASPAAAVFPGAAGSPVAPEDRAFEVLHALYWLCATLAARRPLLLVVDDAHWADLASLRFLAYLAQRRHDLALALLVATRPAEAPAEDELLVRLLTDPQAVVVRPAPLSPGGVAALLREDLGREPDPAVVEACHAATGGTPFLLRELLRELRERSLQPVAEVADRIRELGPRTIARAVLARVRRLGPEAEAVARTAAVLGADAQPWRIARLTGAGEAAVGAALDALAGAGVVRDARPVEFVHPIVRSAIYAEIPPGARAALHARAGAELAGEGVAEERVASHLLATAPAGDQGNVELLRRTAQAALDRGAPRSAAALLERALAEPPPPGLRVAVLHELGAAEVQAGRTEQGAAHLLEALHLSADRAQRVRVANDLVPAFAVRGEYDVAFRAVEEALGEVRDEDGDVALMLEAQLLQFASLEPSLSARFVDRDRVLRRELTGPSRGAGEYAAAVATHLSLRGLASAAEIRRRVGEAHAAGVILDPGTGWAAWNNVIYPLISADGFDLAERLLTEAFEALAHRPSVIGGSRAHTARAMLRLRQGALAEAVADARTALAAGHESGAYILILAASALVDAQTERGELAATRALLTELGWDGELPDRFLHNWLLAARGRLSLAEGDLPRATAELEELHRRHARRSQRNPGVVAHGSTLALALLRSGQRDRAAAVAREELAAAERWGASRALGIALRAVGLCEGDLERLRASAEVLTGSGARLEHARSLVELGAALRRARARSDAREPLHAGMELAHRCGATPLVERAREELLATGARPRRIVRTGVDALTPSELRVARLAAQGLTNREVAEALFVTPRTVETHLTQAFRKLDVASRTDLAQRLSP